MWPLFLLLHLVGLVGYSLLLRKSLVAKVDSWTLATVMQTAIAIPMLPFLFIYTPKLGSYTPSELLQIVIITAFVILLHLTNVQALKALEASTFSILYNLRIIFATILGIVFLDEKVIPLQILGGLLIFAAVLTVRQKGSKKLTNTGLKWGIAAAIVISILNLFEKKTISEVGFFNYAIPVMISAAVIMWIILLAQGKRIQASYFKDKDTIWLMVLRALSAYGFTLAFNAGAKLSVATYISSLSVIIIVLLGAVLLGERDYIKQKIIATALAFSGLTLILIADLIK